MRKIFLLLTLCYLSSCTPNESKNGDKKIPVVGFLDYVNDATLARAKQGFYDALKANGYIEDSGTVKIIYRNANGDQPTMLQSCEYILAQHPDLIATNPTLPTITAVQKTKDVPVFMMVSPRPDIAKLTDANGKAPANLFGTYETLDYIDTAVALIKTVFPNAKKIGTIYNQSEPQSVDAMNRLQSLCERHGFTFEKLPVNNTNEAQLVTAALLHKKIDAFFALPDNIVFSAMEVIVKECDAAHVPVFTSEEGLVKRGALAGFGADMYQWGYQSGVQAALFLKTKSTAGMKPEIVQVRRRVYNPTKAKILKISFDSAFVAIGN